MTLSLVVIFGLLASMSWGVSDFSGGVATRKHNVFKVLIVSQIIGLLALLLIIIGYSSEKLDLGNFIWSVLAGVSGGIGLIALYRGLALGRASIVAPTSAVLSTALPLVFSIVYIGPPTVLQGVGLLFGIISIVIFSTSTVNISLEKLPKIKVNDLKYGLSSGGGFGLFFIFIDQFESESVYWPLAMLRFSSITFLILISWFIGSNAPQLGSEPPLRLSWKIIMLAGLGDTAGNVFFTLASQSGRLDIAAITSSLFPLITVFLSWLIYDEEIKSIQKIGIIGAICSVIIISI